MEWIVFVILLIIGFMIMFLKGSIFLLFIIPALFFFPPLINFLEDKEVFIPNALRIVITLLFCSIGTFLFVNDGLEMQENIEIINPMDGLVLEETKLLTLDDENGNIGVGEGENNINGQQYQEDIPFTVYYYYDGLLLEGATETFVAKSGDVIDKYTDKSLGLYDLSHEDNFPLEILKSDVELKINVYYTKKKNVIPYTIRYYYNGRIDSSKTKFLEGIEGSIIDYYPPGDKEGYVQINTAHFPLELTKDNCEIKIYYGFNKETIMEEVGLVDGFAPSVKLEKKDENGNIYTADCCPFCLQPINLDYLEKKDDGTYLCPLCAEPFVLNKDNVIVSAEFDEEGNLKEAKIDNPEQQNIPEKWALDKQQRIIHNKLCYFVRQIPKENFEGSNLTINELQENYFYTKCKKCNPAEKN